MGLFGFVLVNGRCWCVCKHGMVQLVEWTGMDWTGLARPVLTFDLQKAAIANIPGRDESIMLFSSQYAFRPF